GEGPIHYGVCSNYLRNINENEDIHVFVRSASSFHLPNDMTRPIIMVGPGTGIAPFRAFWQHRKYQRDNLLKAGQTIGKAWLFFGCRQRSLDLYRKEKQDMLEDKVLDKVFLALSREPTIPKTYATTDFFNLHPGSKTPTSQFRDCAK
ncbi:unnamed protein product, partial [Timema podura]|nr:unnamed protein product [Timema podura]